MGCKVVAEMSVQLPTGSAKMTYGWCVAELVHHSHQLRKAAAETTARYFARSHPLRSRELGVHERITLVIQNDGGSESAAFEFARAGENQRGFPGAQKAADEDQQGAAGHA